MKRVSADGERFTVAFDYSPSLVEVVKYIPGRRWEKDRRLWTFPLNAGAAKSLIETLGLLDFEFTLEFRAGVQQLEANIEASRAQSSDISLPCPEGLAYLPFQRAGIAFALGKPNVLIADEPGLGKTIQAIGVINACQGIRRVLVICPATAKINWSRELERWLTTSLTIEIADAQNWPSSDIVIVNYDVLDRHTEVIREREWDLLCVDESHYIKNPKTTRTQQVLGKWSREPEERISRIPARRTIFMTGTPITNRPIELWPLVKDAGIFRSWKTYVERYCDGYQEHIGKKVIWHVDGASNLDELQATLRSCWMVRRLKKDVLTELPPKRRQVIELPANGLGSVIRAEHDAYRKHLAELQALKAAVEQAKAGDSDEDYAEAVASLKRGVMFALQDVSRKRHETAVAKLPQVVQFVENELETEEKIVVFAHHHDVIDGLEKAFHLKCMVVTGETSMTDRQYAIDVFQRNPGINLFIGSIGAAGTAITLHASSHVIFAELDWVPGNITQAEDRTHRIGQKKSVLCQHLVLEGSLDATMARMIVRKQEVIDAALDDPLAIGSIPVLPMEEPATADISRKQVAEQAVNITAEEIAEVHTQLRFLAGICDGAREKDDIGFNRLDTAIGRALASQQRLSPKQAVLGRRILAKYHRQLGLL